MNETTTPLSYASVAKMIDHALLTPAFTRDDLLAGSRLARAYDVVSVCILPYALPLARDTLAGSTVKATTVIGFPHGAHATAVKVAETACALEDGAEEVDMVVNISAVRSGDWEYVRRDINGVITTAHGAGKKVKVIFENAYLDREQKIRLCEISAALGADWVKTSTGFGPSGATLEDLELMRAHTPANVAVKASGGVRTLDQLLAVRAIGVSRCGTSATKTILDEARERLGFEPIRLDQVSVATSGTVTSY
jgi:deoxyribose-phosphate aldolase